MKWTGLIIHCSASRFGDAAAIRSWHKARGWADIGYHAVILNGYRDGGMHFKAKLDGKIEPGRPESKQGAHCAAQGMNRKALGKCRMAAGRAGCMLRSPCGRTVRR